MKPIRTILAAAGLVAVTFGLQAQAAPLADGDIFVVDLTGGGGLLNDAVFKIDRATGDRTIVSQFGSVGSGPSPSNLFHTQFDANGRIIAADNNTGRIFRIDPTTGDRTVISGGGVGVGPGLVVPTGIAIGQNGDIYVSTLAGGPDLIMRVDPTTGNRTVVSGGAIGSGPAFINISEGLAVGSNGDLYVQDIAANRIFRIDPITGARTILSDNTNTGPFLQAPINVEFGNNELFVATNNNDEIQRVDLTTGNRTNASTGLANFGGEGFFPRGMKYLGNELLVVDIEGDRLFSIDLATGTPTVISDGKPLGGLVGGGPNFGGGPFGLAVYQAPSVVPASEPGALALFGLGLAGIGFAARRRRRAG